MAAPKPPEEEKRLQALYEYAILDTPLEEDYEDITALAAEICQMPIAVINLIDRDRQWFKAEIGLGVRETPLDVSICAHAILQNDFFIVPDTLLDERFACNPLVTGDPHLRFYAGALLKSESGQPLGTLCVLDYTPRELSEFQRKALMTLSRQVMAQMELRRRAVEAERLNEHLTRSMVESHHRIKNSLQALSALVELQIPAKEETVSVSTLHRLKNHLIGMATIHDLLTHKAGGDKPDHSVSARTALEKLIPLLRGAAGGERIQDSIEEIALPAKQATSLSLLVSELVSNAVKHGGDGPIEISLTQEGDKVRLRVRDSGPGFPEGFDASSAANTGLSLIENVSRFDLKGETFYTTRNEGSGGQVTVEFRLAASE